MFLKQVRPKDYECGFNLELMIQALPRIQDTTERIAYAKRIVGLIKQSHINWVEPDGQSPEAWAHFFHLATFDPRKFGIENPFEVGAFDDAR
jgi:hypothetical protein